MSLLHSPSGKDTSPRLAPRFKDLSKMTAEELREELSSHGQSTSGNKAVLFERLKKCITKQEQDAPTIVESSQSSELTVLYQMMKQQHEADRADAERRFQLQLEESRSNAERRFQLQLEESRSNAERRFQLQLEEIRQNAKAERHHLVEFLADTVKKTQDHKSCNSGESNSPDVIGKKFRRLNSEYLEVIQTLELKYTNSRSTEEIDVFIKAVEIAMTDLKDFTDSKIDRMGEGELKDEIVHTLKESKQVYLTHIPLAKSRYAQLKAEENADKLAGSLPVGVIAPVFYGDILAFPTFWESFCPLVHENPKVSRFYKMTYLKSAMKGSASGILNGFPCTTHNYEPAMALVLKRYGRKQSIVRSHIKDLLDGQRIEMKVGKVKNLLDKANAKKSVLSQNGITWDQMFTQILENQLPATLYERWIRKISPLLDADKIPDSELLFEFMATELATMESLQKNNDNKQSAEKRTKSPQVGMQSLEQPFSAKSLVTQSCTSACAFCGMTHSLKDCATFLKASPTERMASLITKPGKVCFRCLAPKGEEGHPRHFYQCKERCTVKDCGKPHHKLLHVHDNAGSTKVLLSTVRSDSSTPKLSDSQITTILPTALALILHGGESKRVRIAFDSLSQKSFITRNLANDLKLPSVKTDLLNISGFGGHSTSKRMDTVKFVLKPLLPDCTRSSIEIEALVQDGMICNPMEGVTLLSDQVSHLEGLQLADPMPRGEGNVDILLGGRYYYSLMQGTVISPKILETGPFAIETMFGWVLAGPCDRRTCTNEKETNCLLIETAQSLAENLEPWKTLDSKLERFWRQDCIGLIDKKRVYTSDETDAMTQFNRSVSFDGDKYRVSFPFRPDATELKSNYPEAVSRLRAIEKSLRKNPERADNYNKAIMEYVTNGFARKLTPDEYKTISKTSHYFVPHHPVFKDSSSSTKLRIVFDASSKNCEGISLNDNLLTGPNLLPDIGSVLLRFRTYRIALNGDIRKMFCQTEVNPDHQRYQLYLWRNCDSLREPDIYMMERVMFGVSSSPFLAIQAIHHHANSKPIIQRFGQSFIESTINNMYVDDIHVGGDSVVDVIAQQQQLVDFFKSGGWTLVKFASNDQEVMNRIPEDARLPNCVLDFDDADFGEAASLGLKWHTTNDNLYCNVKQRLCAQDNIVTKRSVLSKLSQIYDVFGFFSGFVIQAKMLLQELWKRKLDWNDTIDEKNEAKYRRWTEELKLLESIKIPRFIFSQLEKVRNVQLHGFADASESAYGAVIYVRAEDSQGNVRSSFLIAKTRVAPLKAMSIARLELMAAHTLAKLTNYVVEAWNSRLLVDKIYLWLDSEIALAWIAKPSSHWKMFVRNRVQEIHDLVSPSAWKHCPGIENPADLLSRGISLSELKSSSLYWFGPSWLLLEDIDWPSKSPIPESGAHICVNEEAAKTQVLVTKVNSSIPFYETRYSNYPMIIRVTARILRWRNRNYSTLDPNCDNRFIGPNEYKAAETALFRKIQRARFNRDICDLESGKNVSGKCRFKDMDPTYDHERGIIVSGNRLSLSNLPVQTAHPIILPSREPLIEKLILHVHESNSHSPQDTTIAILRERFHIIHIRNEVRRTLRQCKVCQHWATKQLTQKMGILPEERVCAAPAFSQIGLDFTGPVYIKANNGVNMRKAYICLFTCAHSRMVHLELTNDMSTEEFLGAFKRMINRRGWCHKIISDNQLTFKKAEKIIGISIGALLKRNLDSEAFQKFLTENDITWTYITERSPHRGAFYERMNRSLKEPLRKILGKAKLTYSEFYTVLTDIESALNQRPLTYLGCDPKNPQAITPAHLAIGRPLHGLPFAPSTQRINVTKRFLYLQTLLRHFWGRWTKEYLPTLLRRNKWITEQKVPKVGDVCLIADGYSRSTWTMGRITDAIMGKDGLIRTFKLQTAKGILSRPIQKLHLLEEN